MALDAIQTLIAELRDYKQSENAQRIRATVETMVAAFQQVDTAIGGFGTIAPGFNYQTGVWTPVDNSGAGLVFLTPSGTWTRIGNMVFIHAVFQYPATANAANANWGGLPFPPDSNRSQGLVATSGPPFPIYQPISGTSAGQVLATANGAPVTNATLTGAFMTINQAYETAAP